MKNIILGMSLLLTLTACPSFFILEYVEVDNPNNKFKAKVEGFDFVQEDDSAYLFRVVTEGNEINNLIRTLVVIKNDTILPKVLRVTNNNRTSWGDTIFYQINNATLRDMKKHKIILIQDSVSKEYKARHLNTLRRISF